MMHWFVYKGKNSYSDFGLWISKLPKIVKASERYEEVTIPGREGSMILLEGEDVYDSYPKECTVICPNNREIQGVKDWLRGSGDLYFSNEPGFVYEARIMGRVEFDRVGNSLLQAKIPFYVKPFKKRLHAGGDTVTVTDLSATLYNPGDVYSRPRISISGSGSNTITIDGQEMSFSGISGTIVVDCSAEIITQNGSLWSGSASGEFWKLPKGQISLSQTSSMELTIEPEWRWV